MLTLSLIYWIMKFARIFKITELVSGTRKTQTYICFLPESHGLLNMKRLTMPFLKLEKLTLMCGFCSKNLWNHPVL